MNAISVTGGRAVNCMTEFYCELTLRDFLADRAGAVDWIRSQVTNLLPELCIPVESASS
ncbi:hypothetical protein [Brevibacterium zhoupengii]|uniref:hypothetical protein n=1 Tax=Brevibacterium zhoupengii TaxID=2898795 RepID=UPI001E29462A|nr:hypothetical protein [Brevibacterium zhoupengii]